MKKLIYIVVGVIFMTFQTFGQPKSIVEVQGVSNGTNSLGPKSIVEVMDAPVTNTAPVVAVPAPKAVVATAPTPTQTPAPLTEAQIYFAKLAKDQEEQAKTGQPAQMDPTPVQQVPAEPARAVAVHKPGFFSRFGQALGSVFTPDMRMVNASMGQPVSRWTGGPRVNTQNSWSHSDSQVTSDFYGVRKSSSFSTGYQQNSQPTSGLPDYVDPPSSFGWQVSGSSYQQSPQPVSFPSTTKTYNLFGKR